MLMPPLPLALGAMNYLQILRDASVLELAVLALLMVVSVSSWALIALKHTQLSRARTQSLTFLDSFWKASRLEAIYQDAQKLEGSPLSKVFCAGYEELTKLAQTKEGAEGAMSERLGRHRERGAGAQPGVHHSTHRPGGARVVPGHGRARPRRSWACSAR